MLRVKDIRRIMRFKKALGIPTHPWDQELQEAKMDVLRAGSAIKCGNCNAVILLAAKDLCSELGAQYVEFRHREANALGLP